MNLNEAIEIVERWYAGGYATQIADMNPAIKLLLEAGTRLQSRRDLRTGWEAKLLPGETKE